MLWTIQFMLLEAFFSLLYKGDGDGRKNRMKLIQIYRPISSTFRVEESLLLRGIFLIFTWLCAVSFGENIKGNRNAKEKIFYIVVLLFFFC